MHRGIVYLPDGFYRDIPILISKKTVYALRALEYLAKHKGDGPVLIDELSKKGNIPKKYLEAILLSLKNNGILTSKKGKGGGYSLGMAPNEIILGMVVRTLEGTIAPIKCAEEKSSVPCDECDDDRVCGIRLVMIDVRQAISKVLDETTLADMLDMGEKEHKRIKKILVYEI